MPRVKVDKPGRVMIPRSIREALGFVPGTELSVRETDGAIVMRPTKHAALLKRIDGILVFTGGRVTGDMTNIIQKVREERIRTILRLPWPRRGAKRHR